MFGGGLQHAPAAFTADVAEAQHSLHRLADVRGRRMYFAHGAEINDPWAALAALLDR
jgi:hypothetical protein